MDRKERGKLYAEMVRKLALARLGNKCAQCGSTTNLHIHHKDNNLKNFDENNLKLLCGSCHGKEHGTVFNPERLGTPRIRTTFYLENDLMAKFKEICIREDESMSRKVETFMERYVAVHSEGNPQLRMDRYVKPILKTCFFCQGHFKSLKKVKFVSGLVAAVCDSCLAQPTQQRCVKKVLGAE